MSHHRVGLLNDQILGASSHILKLVWLALPCCSYNLGLAGKVNPLSLGNPTLSWTFSLQPSDRLSSLLLKVNSILTLLYSHQPPITCFKVRLFKCAPLASTATKLSHPSTVLCLFSPSVQGSPPRLPWYSFRSSVFVILNAYLSFVTTGSSCSPNTSTLFHEQSGIWGRS